MSNGGPSHSQQNLNDSEDQLETEKQALILLKKLQDLKVSFFIFLMIEMSKGFCRGVKRTYNKNKEGLNTH